GYRPNPNSNGIFSNYSRFKVLPTHLFKKMKQMFKQMFNIFQNKCAILASATGFERCAVHRHLLTTHRSYDNRHGVVDRRAYGRTVGEASGVHRLSPSAPLDSRVWTCRDS